MKDMTKKNKKPTETKIHCLTKKLIPGVDKDKLYCKTKPIITNKNIKINNVWSKDLSLGKFIIEEKYRH